MLGPSGPPGTLVLDEDEAYVRLRGDIASGLLSPNEHLVEQQLTARYGVSRAAIRTALVRLEQDGLVVRERHRGARVRLVSEREAIEIIEARAALESVAAGYAAMRASQDDVEALRAIAREMAELFGAGDFLGMSECNARMHGLILEISGHETVRRLTATLNSQVVRFAYRTILAPGRPACSLAEHQGIVEAIASGDAQRAEQLMRVHLSHVAETLQERAQGDGRETADTSETARAGELRA